MDTSSLYLIEKIIVVESTFFNNSSPYLEEQNWTMNRDYPRMRRDALEEFYPLPQRESCLKWMHCARKTL